MKGFNNSLALRAAIFANQAQYRGEGHLAAGFAALARQLNAGPAESLTLPKRPGVFGIVHPLDQLRATRPAFPSATIAE